MVNTWKRTRQRRSKKTTINRRWWKQGWDQVCLDTVLFPCSLRKQPTFRDATTGFPAKWRLRNEYRNSIMMTYRYPDSDWLCCVTNLLQPIRSTTQIRVVTRHQYGISVLVSHFRGETSGGCFLGVFSVSLQGSRLFLFSIKPFTPKIWFSQHGLSV